jgi:chromosome segregation ATPase
LEQLKELKDTVNNINEINRKLYEENQQYKDRNIEQRQQIEHYHVLFQENQQKNEQTLCVLRKEKDDVYQRENELKRRMQQTLDSKQQENYLIISSLNDKLEDLKASESHLCDELSNIKLEMQQERNKAELLEKKCKLLEKDNSLLKESWNLEKSGLMQKINDLEKQIELIKKQHLNEKQKMEDSYSLERGDLKNQLTNLENKLEEVIKEKAQISCKYGQLAENNRELNTMLQNKESFHENKIEETK